MPGVYAVCNGQAQVFVCNFGEVDRVIPEASLLTYGSATELMPAVSALSHVKPKTLTPAEVAERKDFLRKSLKLDASSVLQTNPQLQTKLIQLLMENFDAISISDNDWTMTDNDFGKTNLVRFRIDLKPGTKPELGH